MAITTQPALGASTGRGTYAPPDPHVIRIRDLIYTEAGIFYPDNKLQILEERCVTRMKEAGAGNIPSYYRLLTTGPTRRDELVDLLNKITVGETCFFRNQAQLDALRKIMLPKIVEARLKTGMPGIRIWSAGCSTGEEPYTLAMILSEEKQGALKGFNFEVHATDLNEISLEQAQKGLYGDYSTRHLTPYFKQKYFTESNGMLQVKSSLQTVVRFNRVNLQDHERMALMKGMDVIFCCNVLIYFDTASKRQVIQHFFENLLAHGFLFLGHSESLYGVSEDFHLVHMPSATAYAKGQSAPAGRGQL